MKDLYKKLPSEEFAKKLIIVSLATFGLSVVLIIFTLFRVYSVVGNNLDAVNNTTNLETYQRHITVLSWIMRITVGTMIVGGIVIALQHEKKTPGSKS